MNRTAIIHIAGFAAVGIAVGLRLGPDAGLAAVAALYILMPWQPRDLR